MTETVHYLSIRDMLRCAFLTYTVNPRHWLSHCNIFHLLGDTLQLLPFQMLMITLSITAEVFFILNLFKIIFLLRQGVTIQPWLAQILLCRPASLKLVVTHVPCLLSAGIKGLYTVPTSSAF